MDKRLSLNEIKRRVRSSFVSLAVRKIILRTIGFLTVNIVLARLLPVETLGIFNIANAIIIFFAFFSDIGLAGSLIQKKESVTNNDIRTTFTIQQFLVGVISFIIIFTAPLFANTYSLNEDGIWLIRILGFSFFLSSLKVIPSVLLERGLRFNPLVFVEILETLLFNGLLIILVVKGFGIWSFSAAALARGISGTLLIYILVPTRVGIGIDRQAVKKLLSFGIPFQLNTLLALAKDRLVPLVIAGMVTPTHFSFITWSQAMALLPLELIGEINRVAFPAFSRLQQDKKSLATAVEKALFAACILIFPLLFGLVAIFPFFIRFVVTSKFEPATLSFYLFAFSSYWAVISTIFTNTLNAIGQITTTLKLMVFWTVATWFLTPALVYFYGFIGVSVTAFIISFTSIVTIILVKRVLAVKVLDSIFLPTLCSSIMAGLVYIFSLNFVKDKYTFIFSIVLGGLIYAFLITVLARKRIVEDIRSLRNA